jgi:hypothetical protein
VKSLAQVKDEKSLANFKKAIDDMISQNRTEETKRYTATHTDAQIKELIEGGSLTQIRNVSRNYFKTNGLYRRILLYMVTMSTYDYMLTPKFLAPYKTTMEKVFLKNYNDTLYYLDDMKIPLEFSRIFANMLIDGAYYGLVVADKSGFTFYDLPLEYCRTQYKDSNGLNILEFDMRYFDKLKRKSNFAKLLESYPRSVQNYYKQYSNNINNETKLSNWMIVSNDEGVAFYYKDLYPFFISIIPALIDLKEYKGIEKSRDEQELSKILIQKLPLDDNNELVFDLAEAAEIHRGIVAMLKNSPSVDVLTTFCDATIETLQDGRRTVKDNLEKMERSVYNEAGMSRNLFASDSSVALESSIKNDFAIVCDIMQIFNSWLNFFINKKFSVKNEYFFEVNILPISHYNREEMLDLYLKAAQSGYGRILAGIASGLKQSNIMNIFTLETEILKLPEIMQPLQTSSTLSGDEESGSVKKDGKEIKGNKKPLDKKTEKTVKNIESKQ